MRANLNVNLSSIAAAVGRAIEYHRRQATASQIVPAVQIHQFISQTGNVYVTLESKESRLITLEMGRYVQSDEGELPIFPILFSRSSGYDFLCVRKAGGLLLPRDPDDLPDKIRRSDLKGDKEVKRPKRVLTEDDFPDGYLILPEAGDEFWTETDEDQLPDNWFVKRKGEEQLDNFFEHRIPHRLYFDAEGNFSRTADYPDWGWFISAPLSFDPTSGVIFDERVRENTNSCGSEMKVVAQPRRS